MEGDATSNFMLKKLAYNRAENPISVMLVATVVFADFGGGGYLAVTALGAAWDAAVAGFRS